MELRRRQSAPILGGGAILAGSRKSARVLLTRGWITLHAVVWVAAVTMVFLGRWQLQVSDDKHFDLQNFGYALQWWTFTAFALFFWLRAMRDARRPVGQVVGGSRLYVRPSQDTTNGVSDGTLSTRGPSDPARYVGLADLVTIPDEPGASPLRYHGYLMPNSASTPARSGDDRYRASYNDYLWQLAQSDDSNGRDSATSRPEPATPRVIEASTTDDHAKPDAR